MVNRQYFRNSEIKLRVDGREDKLEHREWSEAKVTLSQRRKRNQKSDWRGKRSVHSSSVTKNGASVVCKEAHALSVCRKFLKLPSRRRRQRVRWVGICFRCLGSNHRMESCQSNDQCRHCYGEHNSLLHLEATEDRTRADQRAGFGEAVVASEETTRKNGPDSVINIDGWMTYIPGTPRTVQLASADSKIGKRINFGSRPFGLDIWRSLCYRENSIAVRLTEARGLCNCLRLLEGSSRTIEANDIS